MKNQKVDPQKLEAMVKSGLTTRMIAEEFDCSEVTIRRWGRELGLARKREVYRTVRDRAEDLPPTQAKDYLLDVLGLLHDALAYNAPHAVDTFGFHLTPAERRFLICLVDAGGETRTREQALAAVRLGAVEDQIEDPAVLAVYVCRIRKRLTPDIGRIETVWGTGWRWVAGESV